jgi:surface protein
MNNMFKDCFNLKSINLDNFSTESVVDFLICLVNAMF